MATGAGTVGLVVAMALLLSVGVSGSRSGSQLKETPEQGTLAFIEGEARPRSKGGAERIDGGAGDVDLYINRGSRMTGVEQEKQGTWALVEAGDGALDSSRVSRWTVDQGKQGRAWVLILAAGVMVVAGVGVIMMAFPVVLVCIVRMLGFTAQGIVAGSRAAFIMSLYAGRVAVGSFCAICQSIGALGVAAICVCGPLIAIAVTLSLLVIGLLCAILHAHPDLLPHLWNSIIEHGRSILDYLRSL